MNWGCWMHVPMGLEMMEDGIDHKSKQAHSVSIGSRDLSALLVGSQFPDLQKTVQRSTSTSLLERLPKVVLSCVRCIGVRERLPPQMAFLQNDASSLERIREGLKNFPPRPPHAYLPLSAQLAVADFAVRFVFSIEGVGHNIVVMPSVTVPVNRILLMDEKKHRHSNHSLEDEEYDIDTGTVVEIANTLLQQAYEQHHLFTEEEMTIFQESINTSGKYSFAVKLRSSTADDSSASSHQYAGILSLINLMDQPRDWVRWMRKQVSHAFSEAAASQTILGGESPYTRQTKSKKNSSSSDAQPRDDSSSSPATTTTLELSIEALVTPPDQESFYLAQYEEHTERARPFDVEAWQRYARRLQVRARRQAAEGAFYGSLKALQQPEDDNDEAKKKRRLWRRRKYYEKQQKATQQAAGIECDRIKELRTRMDQATSMKTVQIEQLQHQQQLLLEESWTGESRTEECSDSCSLFAMKSMGSFNEAD